MARFVITALAAGAVMWLFGFILYGVLFNVGWATAPEATQLAIQQALKALPHSGSYYIPVGESKGLMDAFVAGPVAQISYNTSGFPIVDTVTFIAGFVQFSVVAAMIGWLLAAVPLGLAGRMKVVIGLAAIAVVYIHLSDPIWYHSDWRNPLYKSFADVVILCGGGFVMARWALRRAS